MKRVANKTNGLVDITLLFLIPDNKKNILKNMTKIVNKIKEERIDAILHELQSVNDDHRMFEAVKKLHQKPFENPTIYNDQDKIMTSNIVFTNMEQKWKNMLVKQND